VPTSSGLSSELQNKKERQSEGVGRRHEDIDIAHDHCICKMKSLIWCIIFENAMTGASAPRVNDLRTGFNDGA
jgi:hypothetical protein